MQDKGALLTPRTASGQPAALPKPSHVRKPETIAIRAQNHTRNAEKLEKITVYVPSTVKAELQRLADQGGAEGEELSLSAVASAFLQRQVQGHIDMQYGALLGPMLKKVHQEENRTLRKFLTLLLVRIGFDTGQTRAICTNILGRQPGMTPEICSHILDKSADTAKSNLTRKTPQIEALLDVLDQWAAEEHAAHAAPSPWHS